MNTDVSEENSASVFRAAVLLVPELARFYRLDARMAIRWLTENNFVSLGRAAISLNCIRASEEQTSVLLERVVSLRIFHSIPRILRHVTAILGAACITVAIASVYTASLKILKWRQHIAPKCRYKTTRCHRAEYHKLNNHRRKPESLYKRGFRFSAVNVRQLCEPEYVTFFDANLTEEMFEFPVCILLPEVDSK